MPIQMVNDRRAVWWDASRLKWIPLFLPAVGGFENIEGKKSVERERVEDHLSLTIEPVYVREPSNKAVAPVGIEHKLESKTSLSFCCVREC